ncbi:hypothetical protein Daus18300_010336 [Diaporthe australafricana]|uniref:Major facilitator superfamily (MFS) profile domain-containing protein n=1 Tax=Diaporthe australafricana TaxID=127596 RepID=A0ABR3WAI8_9PEZI
MDQEKGLSVPSDSEKPYVSDRDEGQESRVGPKIDSGSDKRLGSDSPTAPGPGQGAPQILHDPIPDGGTEAWLQVLGSWVVLVATWGLVNTFGVFQAYYETTLLTSSSSSSISWIGSLQACLLQLVGVVAGPLYDAGYFRHLLISGLILIVFGQFMISLGTEYWHFLLAQGVCVGVGMGFIMLPSTAILSQYFTAKRAFAIGIASTGSPLAGIVFPVIFSRLVSRIGFGWATRVIAFILLGLSVIPIVFMKTRVPPSGRARALVDTSALRDEVFVLFMVASFFMFLCLYTAFFCIQLFCELHRLSSLDFAPYTVTLLNVGSVFGRILPNYLADKVGSVNVIIVCAAVSAILLYGWLGIHNLAGLIVFALLYGMFSGGVVSVLPSAILTMSPDMSRVGTRMGMTFTLAGISVLVGTPIAGAILGEYSDSEWMGVIGYSAAGLTLGTMLYLASRVALYRRNGKKVG